MRAGVSGSGVGGVRTHEQLSTGAHLAGALYQKQRAKANASDAPELTFLSNSGGSGRLCV